MVRRCRFPLTLYERSAHNFSNIQGYLWAHTIFVPVQIQFLWQPVPHSRETNETKTEKINGRYCLNMGTHSVLVGTRHLSYSCTCFFCSLHLLDWNDGTRTFAHTHIRSARTLSAVADYLSYLYTHTCTSSRKNVVCFFLLFILLTKCECAYSEIAIDRNLREWIKKRQTTTTAHTAQQRFKY